MKSRDGVFGKLQWFFQLGIKLELYTISLTAHSRQTCQMTRPRLENCFHRYNAAMAGSPATYSPESMRAEKRAVAGIPCWPPSPSPR